jgi:hypothetical protein
MDEAFGIYGRFIMDARPAVLHGFGSRLLERTDLPIRTRRKGCEFLQEALNKGYSASALPLAHWYLSENHIDKGVRYRALAARSGTPGGLLEFALTLRRIGGKRDRETEFSIFLALGTSQDEVSEAATVRRRRRSTLKEVTEENAAFTVRMRLAGLHRTPLTEPQRVVLRKIHEDAMRQGFPAVIDRIREEASQRRINVATPAQVTGDFAAALAISFMEQQNTNSKFRTESAPFLDREEAICVCCGPEYKWEQLDHAGKLLETGEESGPQALLADASAWYSIATMNGAQLDQKLEAKMLRYRREEVVKTAHPKLTENK